MTKTNLGIRLLYANSESEVQEIIDSDPEMSNSKNWYPLDNRVTNNNTIGNQSSNGGKAATELITNMVDAILTKRCLEEKIDPKSAQAPQTMYEAVERFITPLAPLSGGKIVNVDDAPLRKYSKENLIIGITGRRKSGSRPCYVFCDNGEGQSPEDFEKTFLSLSTKYKSEIPFVQGKYNMGSSGVLNFCGDKWFKLILSRRYDGKTPWGWTLIRRNRPQSGEDYAEYFALGGEKNKTIQKIDDDLIYPLITEKGKYEDFSLKTGTVIKLYDYFTGRASTGFKESREIFNENLVETILPFQIYDCRWWKPEETRGGLRGYGIDARRFCGLEFQLLRKSTEELDNIELETGEPDVESEKNDALNVAAIKHPVLGKISISAVVLKKGVKGWFRKSNNRIFHHVNGQVQCKQQRGMLTHCGFPALKDRVVIFVDSSHLSESARKDIWKGDRETIKETVTGELYKEIIKERIKNSATLKETNHRIANEIMEDIIQDSSRDILKDILKRDKHFAFLLKGGVPVVNVDRRTSKQDDSRSDLKHDPSYVKLLQNPEMQMAINKGRPIACDTDAVDNFLARPDNCGEVIFNNDDVEKKFSYSCHLRNGKLIAFITPIREDVKVGDSIKFRIGLHSPAMPEPKWSEEMEIQISPDQPKNQHTPRDNKPDNSQMAGLPNYKLVTKDGRELPGDPPRPTEAWEDAELPSEFNGKDGGFVQDTGEESMYYINYDNDYFQSYLSSAKQDVDRTEFTEKYILGMCIMLIGVEHTLKLSEKYFQEKHGDNRSEIQEEIRRRSAAAAASVILTLSDTLPKIFNKKDDDE